MVALEFCDMMVSAADADRSLRLAQRLLESTLNARAEIEKFDDSLSPANPLQFDRQSAALIRSMYEQWVDDAESLLKKIAEVELRFGPIAETEPVKYAVGTTRAMLSISLDKMEAGSHDIAEGRLHTMEEVRRELHHTPH